MKSVSIRAQQVCCILAAIAPLGVGGEAFHCLCGLFAHRRLIPPVNWGFNREQCSAASAGFESVNTAFVRHRSCIGHQPAMPERTNSESRGIVSNQETKVPKSANGAAPGLANALSGICGRLMCDLTKCGIHSACSTKSINSFDSNGFRK